MSAAEYLFHEGDHALLRLGTADVEFEVPESDLHPPHLRRLFPRRKDKIERG